MYVTKKIYKLSDIKYKNLNIILTCLQNCSVKWNNDVVKIKKSIQKSKNHLFGDVFSQVVIAKGKIENNVIILDNDKKNIINTLWNT